MAWMVQLTVPGYLVAGAVFASFHLLAELVSPVGPWRVIGRPAAHTLAEALRFSFPFGGVPLATLGMSQVGGPLVGVVRVGGVILLTWLVFQVGISLVDIVRQVRAGGRHSVRRTPQAAIALAVVIVLLGLSIVAPRGATTGETLRVAAVQGGGEQGTSALEVPSRIVTERHLEATRSIDADERPRSRAVAGEHDRRADLRGLRHPRRDRRRGGAPRRADRGRGHRGARQRGSPHQLPGRRHPRRRDRRPLRQGPPGAVRRVRAAARDPGGDRRTDRADRPRRRRRHRARRTSTCPTAPGSVS